MAETTRYKRLVIPGPVDVRPEILAAQTKPMIGHRSKEFVALFASLQEKLKQVFLTGSRVYVSGSSGTGLWEAASRCCVRDDRKVLHVVSGAFSDRWAKISQENGKQADVIKLEWGQGCPPELVEEALKKQQYDAVCLVHNETSTGVINPLKEIAQIVNQHEDTLMLVDTVSGILGAEVRTDDWGLDVTLTSSQKAFSLPPGLAFAAVSDRALERAKQVDNRGYYFDFWALEESLLKNNTHNTPPISIMFAAEQQLDDILAAGLENWWARHENMRDMTHEWLTSRGFDYFAEEGYRSPTVTAISNTREIDVDAMAKFMYDQKDFTMDKGYGKVKGTTFRIAHMGDMTAETLQEVFAGLDEYLKTL